MIEKIRNQYYYLNNFSEKHLKNFFHDEIKYINPTFEFHIKLKHFDVNKLQPTETNIQNKTIFLKQPILETKNEIKDFAWIIHELTHLKLFTELEENKYKIFQNEKHYKDLNINIYPNNKIEYFCFKKQFEYLLKVQNKSKQYIIYTVKKYFPINSSEYINNFFMEILNEI